MALSSDLSYRHNFHNGTQSDRLHPTPNATGAWGHPQMLNEMTVVVFPAQAPVLVTQQRGETHPSRQVMDVCAGCNNQQAFKQFLTIPFGPDEIFQRTQFLLIKLVEFQSKTTDDGSGYLSRKTVRRLLYLAYRVEDNIQLRPLRSAGRAGDEQAAHTYVADCPPVISVFISAVQAHGNRQPGPRMSARFHRPSS